MIYKLSQNYEIPFTVAKKQIKTNLLLSILLCSRYTTYTFKSYKLQEMFKDFSIVKTLNERNLHGILIGNTKIAFYNHYRPTYDFTVYYDKIH